MTAPDYVWWLLLPAVVVWGVTVVDIVRSSTLASPIRGMWVAAVTAVFPVSLVWYLTRPTRAVAAVPLDQPDQPDRRLLLASLVVARSRGSIDADVYRLRLRALLTASTQEATSKD